MPERYYRSLEELHVSCEKPRAYFIPFAPEQDPTLPREKSALLTDLCGEWDFAYFENIEKLDIEAEGFPSDVCCPDSMTVPFCWQMKLGRGYDVPNYINQDYPFPVDPPHLPDVIPCALYRRTLDFTKKPGKRYYINFEGVAPCFYLWVNGAFSGFSQVSHCTSEFDVTAALADGENTFEVLVVKHCVGSYLEDQDFFRLSGIFREVYILERDENCLRDIFIRPEVSEALDSAEINVLPEFRGGVSFEWRLLTPGGETADRGKSDGGFCIKLGSPVLWNPEEPASYTLEILAGDERISFAVALKRLEIKDRTLLLNGQKIKLRGVNRHDSHPETGYAVTVADMMNDLYILKRGNVNTIRTSHYPNDPRFLDMCERLGFMLIDEADIETHGMGYNYGDWYWDYWSFLSDSPDWREAYLDRAQRLFERDKNHGCVIMWSLGNESGCGENHRQMANYIRSRMPEALIHYENARLEYQERVGKDFTDISDVESRMYASLDYLREYLDDPKHTKPFFYCEYVDSNSTGDIPLYWKDFEDRDNYCGACVWEFCDHAVNIGTREKPVYRYGGDFGDRPNDGAFCADGLVFPDRSPRPGWYDMKISYQPFAVSYENGKIRIKNKRYFRDLSDLYFEWTVEENGRVLSSGRSDKLEIPPRSEKEYKLIEPKEYRAFTTLNISVRQASGTEWADEGFETGFAQFILKNCAAEEFKTKGGRLTLDETRDELRIVGGETEYVFDKNTGLIISVSGNGKTLCSHIGFNLFRAASYGNALPGVWKRARYDEAKQKTYSYELIENSPERIVISTDISFAAAAMPPALRAAAVYTFTPGGALNITVRGKRTDNAPPLPRFGLLLTMPKSFENTEYLGYGPQESYSDMHGAARISLFNQTATDSFVHFIRPQECASHYAVKYASVTDSDGSGLKFRDTGDKGFCFKAIHFNDIQISSTAHDDELEELDATLVSLDYKMHANNQTELDPGRAFDETEFGFSYDIMPVD